MNKFQPDRYRSIRELAPHRLNLRLSVNIALTVGGKPTIPDETLTVVRTYFQDIENIAGNQEEAQIIANELRQELVNQLMRRLESAAE